MGGKKNFGRAEGGEQTAEELLQITDAKISIPCQSHIGLGCRVAPDPEVHWCGGPAKGVLKRLPKE